MFLLSDKQIQYLKTLFNVIFITTIVYKLLAKAWYTLPNNWLFFLTSDAVEYFVCAVVAYMLYYYVLKQKNFWYKMYFVLLLMLVLALLATLKHYRIHDEVRFERTFNFFTEFIGKTFLFYALMYMVNRLDFLNKYKKLEDELLQTKGQLLQNQLHPHFLFNAFNSLYSMSLQEHPNTSNTILKLSDMMRYLTDNSNHKKVKLAYELQFIETYIAIEKIRFGQQAKIDFKIKGNPEGCTIEPLLLITLVENAFKHGFYTNDTSAFVHINVVIENQSLMIKVKNSIQDQQHFNTSDRKGKGLDTLKKRLQLSYPKKHDLVLQRQNDLYYAQLALKLYE